MHCLVLRGNIDKLLDQSLIPPIFSFWVVACLSTFIAIINKNLKSLHLITHASFSRFRMRFLLGNEYPSLWADFSIPMNFFNFIFLVFYFEFSDFCFFHIPSSRSLYIIIISSTYILRTMILTWIILWIECEL